MRSAPATAGLGRPNFLGVAAAFWAISLQRFALSVLARALPPRCPWATELRQAARAFYQADHHPLVGVRPACVQRL